MKEDSTNNLENRVTTETLFTDITEEKIKNFNHKKRWLEKEKKTSSILLTPK